MELGSRIFLTTAGVLAVVFTVIGIAFLVLLSVAAGMEAIYGP